MDQRVTTLFFSCLNFFAEICGKILCFYFGPKTRQDNANTINRVVVLKLLVCSIVYYLKSKENGEILFYNSAINDLRTPVATATHF